MDARAANCIRSLVLRAESRGRQADDKTLAMSSSGPQAAGCPSEPHDGPFRSDSSDLYSLPGELGHGLPVSERPQRVRRPQRVTTREMVCWAVIAVNLERLAVNVVAAPCQHNHGCSTQGAPAWIPCGWSAWQDHLSPATPSSRFVWHSCRQQAWAGTAVVCSA